MPAALGKLRLLHSRLLSFHTSLKERRVAAPRTQRCIEQLLVAMTRNLIWKHIGKPRVRNSQPSSQTLKRRVRNLRQKRSQANQQLHAFSAEKDYGQQCRVRDAWFVRIGLAPPSVPERVLSKWLRDMAIDDQAPVSCSRVGMVRNAWCEVLKTLNRTEVASLVSSLRPPCTPAAVISVFVTHVYDEAVMRMRSHLLASTDDKRASVGSSLLRRAKH